MNFEYKYSSDVKNYNNIIETLRWLKKKKKILNMEYG